MNQEHASFTPSKSPALFNLVDDGIQEAIIAAANVVRYTDGQLIHTRGQIKPGVSIVKSGYAKVGVNGLDGTFIMAGVLGPGESFGEFTIFTDLPRTHDVTASGTTEIYQIDEQRFNKLCDSHPELVKALLCSTLMRTHLLLELLDSMRRLPLKARAVKLLLSIAYTTGSQDFVRIRQTDLAESLGVTRVSLGKVVKKLSNEGLIELGYGKIRFPDRNRLERWLEQQSATPLSY